MGPGLLAAALWHRLSRTEWNGSANIHAYRVRADRRREISARSRTAFEVALSGLHSAAANHISAGSNRALGRRTRVLLLSSAAALYERSGFAFDLFAQP